MAETVVFLHAHPDDEAIFTGGTIAALTDGGHRVVVVMATTGELGVAADPEAPEALPGQRAAETRAACAALGVHRVEFLGYRDSGLPGDPGNDAPGAFCRADTERAARILGNICRTEGAGSLVIYDEGGIYGHPDHLAVSRVGRRAAELASIPTLYEATVDREYLHFVETHLAEQARSAVPDHYDFGVPTVMVSTTIDVRPFLERKRLAIAAHSSQVPETSFAMTMPHGSFAEVYGFEWYVRTGPAGVIDELGF